MDLWKLNGHRSQSNNLEHAEAIFSEQGQLNGQSPQDSAPACADAQWSNQGTLNDWCT
jgi:hypothetical protein